MYYYPIVQVKKLRLRKIWSFAEGHMAGEHDFNLTSGDLEAQAL